MSTATALAAEKTFFDTEAAKLTWDGDRLPALSAISEWYDCAVACAALSAHDVSSYSYAGKSVVRKDLGSLNARRDRLRADFMSLLYGGDVVLVEARTTHGRTD